MKKFITILLIFILLVSLCACGSNKPNGKYSSSFMSVQISGNNITMTIGVGDSNDMISKGTFRMDGNTMICEFAGGGTDKLTYNSSNDTISVYGTILSK